MIRKSRKKSFSKIKKELETEWLAESLKGRVRYSLTKYRKSHDSNYGRVEIWLDDQLVLNSGDLSSILKHGFVYSDGDKHLAAGDITTEQFYDAYYQYINQSIDENIHSDNPLIRLFALFDRRLGKRRLSEVKNEIIGDAQWMEPFYQFRYTIEYK